MSEILIFSGVFSGSAILTGFMRGYAIRKAMLDVPNARSSHTVPTPRGGGVAIVLTVIAGLLLLRVLDAVSDALFLGLLVGGALVAGIGYLDDKRHVPARWRLTAHIAAALFLIAVLGDLPSIPMLGFDLEPGRLGLGVVVLFVVWLLNLYNFMDGIDGIAGVEAVTVGAAAAGLLWWLGEPNMALVVALFAAASLGFLGWNWPPAKIFMGDAGSGFLGFSLAALAVLTWVEAGLSIWTWLILLGVFIVDATITLFRRVLRGERFYEAHRSHAYQHATRHFGAHRPVTVAVGLINLIWLTPLAWAAAAWPPWGGPVLMLAWMPLVVLCLRFKAGLPD